MSLDCWSCGAPSGLPPKGNAWRDPEDDSDRDLWLDGQTGDCVSCGARLLVRADGEHAYTTEAGEEI